MHDKVAILIRPDIGRDRKDLIETIKSVLSNRVGHYSSVESTGDFSEEEFDLMIVLGGDGMMLEAARFCAPRDIPILGLNFGKEGFLTTEKEPEKFVSSIERVLFGDPYIIEERILVNASVWRKDHSMFKATVFVGVLTALNEVYIQGCDGKSVTLHFNINDHFPKTITGDGLMISSSTGSTGYTLYVGPIIAPTVSCLMVRPVHSQGTPILPLVVDTNSVIRVEVFESKGNNIRLYADGQEFIPLEVGDEIIAKKSKNLAKFIRFDKNHFWKALEKRF